MAKLIQTHNNYVVAIRSLFVTLPVAVRELEAAGYKFRTKTHKTKLNTVRLWCIRGEFLMPDDTPGAEQFATLFPPEGGRVWIIFRPALERKKLEFGG
jgi:hypothetical protein